MPDGLIWCALPAATVGLIVRDGTVVDCAPYLYRRVVGRDARQVWRELASTAEDLRWIPDNAQAAPPTGAGRTPPGPARSGTAATPGAETTAPAPGS